MSIFRSSGAKREFPVKMGIGNSYLKWELVIPSANTSSDDYHGNVVVLITVNIINLAWNILLVDQPCVYVYSCLYFDLLLYSHVFGSSSEKFLCGNYCCNVL